MKLMEHFGAAVENISLGDYLYKMAWELSANGNGKDFARERILEARAIFEGTPVLSPRMVGDIHKKLDLANIAEGWATSGPRKKYDLWALDKAWDIDPLNAKGSNAQMTHELNRKSNNAETAFQRSKQGTSSGIQYPELTFSIS